MKNRLERWLEGNDGRPRPLRVLVLAAGAYALFLATWVPLNAFSVGRPAAELYLPGEERLPFVPEAEFAYVLGYVLPVIAVCKAPDARTLVRLSIAFLATLVVAYAVYLAYPVYLERPEFTVDSPATYLLSLEYRDPSYNHLPSLHVALVWLGYFGCRGGLKRPALYAIAATAMTVATVLVKQHYLVDVAAGFALALGAWTLAGRGVPTPGRAGPAGGGAA